MPPALLDTDILSELIKLRNTNVRDKALAYNLEHGRVLVTGNAVHFGWIPGLTIED